MASRVPQSRCRRAMLPGPGPTEQLRRKTSPLARCQAARRRGTWYAPARFALALQHPSRVSPVWCEGAYRLLVNRGAIALVRK